MQKRLAYLRAYVRRKYNSRGFSIKRKTLGTTQTGN